VLGSFGFSVQHMRFHRGGAIVNRLGSAISSRVAQHGLALIEQPSGSFNLNQIPNVVAVYDASQISNLFQDDTKSSAVTASGQSVGAVVDPVSGRDLLQGTSSRKPLYKPTDLNGGPCIVGDGVDDQLVTTTFSTFSQPYTLTMCVQLQSTIAQFLTDGSGISNRAALLVSAGVWSVNCGASTSTGISADTSPHVISIYANGASSVFTIDGTSVNLSVGANAITALHLASRYDDTSRSSARIGMALLTSGQLSSSDLNSVRNYCRTRWGVP